MNVGEKYAIIVNQSGLTYRYNNEAIATVSSDGDISAICKDSVIISVIKADYEIVRIKVTATLIESDCNGNGKFDADDVVLLQQWLLAIPETHLLVENR